MGGCWLSRFLALRRILLGTTVGREIEWLILTELLELPVRQGYRIARKDALAETILGLAVHPVLRADQNLRRHWPPRSFPLGTTRRSVPAFLILSTTFFGPAPLRKRM